MAKTLLLVLGLVGMLQSAALAVYTPPVVTVPEGLDAYSVLTYMTTYAVTPFLVVAAVSIILAAAWAVVRLFKRLFGKR